MFTQKAYIGYTATPFANIFIHHEKEHSQLGLDLFPSAFITTLDAPSNYLGAKRMFGMGENPDEPGLPIYKKVQDAGVKNSPYLPIKHKSTFSPNELPPSLKEAIKAFVIASAIRWLRGQNNKHNTMLIHCTRFNTVQNRLGKLVDEEMESLRPAIINKDEAILRELHDLWARDFVEIGRKMNGIEHTWDEIKPFLSKAVIKMETRSLVINGSIGDILAYKEKESTGLSVIAIGGDKLSRGLTLEGLTISYFTRNTSLYDTLMQMGRWFGYRDGFEDLCRIYTTPDLYEWYRHITTAFENLKEEFIEMARLKLTPKEFGLRVLSHPDMMITNAMKMRQTEKIPLSYRGRLTETTTLPSDVNLINANYDAAEKFIRNLGEPDSNQSDLTRIVWYDKPVKKILDFLSEYRTYKGMPQANTKRIIQYIELQLGKEIPELKNWNVSLVTKKKKSPDDGMYFGGSYILPYGRSIKSEMDDRIFIKRMIDPKDEWVDLTTNERAMIETFESRSDARGVNPRLKTPLLSIYVLNITEKDDDKGAIIPFDKNPVGFSISWSGSKSLIDLTYEVNTVYQELVLNDYDD